ncbi:UDP-N-acetylglucosamine 2-epimerase [Marinospirillum alkaliphilum]|uniref:UDP-N-acetylglucosamine 2-epimerase (Non-hydrolysing) n=1 Tax=Marinospirillum alkaliphilum DSM 21637 TaxID=1122209 RepID=A0A1K1VIQ9_9GAMM|nr:UDP-N-acetylglucosamine 2-epimerase [Marinospirillum alkaliphilum]SFX25018.1 UDP-N-acetylglucosamine 2-epimerase (non-hydrolysing) [Marinospirillum alkaliphilum DSM 21637]
MKKIAVFTGTRAEYGLLYWLMKGIQADPDLELQLIVSGMHLSPEFGYTVNEIEKEFHINERVEMLLSSSSVEGIAKSVGLGVIGFAGSLERLKPDCVVILGDRFEALAIAQTAMILQIPIAHLHGGEITEGAIDDSIRHAITKMAHYHFVSNEEHRSRVLQLGENPKYVINSGALGVENIYRTKILSRTELSESLNFDLGVSFFLITYHPVTSGEKLEDPEQTFLELLDVLKNFPQHKLLFTFPNADHGGHCIVKHIKRYIQQYPQQAAAVNSLGTQRYLSAACHADAVIGNSSSGLIEVPSLKTPTVNIGIRQRGRAAGSSVIHCQASAQSIRNAIAKSLSSKFQEQVKIATNPYGQGDTCNQILNFLRDLPEYKPKQFFNFNQNPENE